DLDGERAVPVPPVEGHGGGQDPCLPGGDLAQQRSGGLMGLDPPDARQHHVRAVIDADRAGTEPARGPRPMPGLELRGGHRLAAVSARMARFLAPRRPYSRDHIEVRTSIMSRTRSSAVSPGSATSTRLSAAASADSRYSTPERASRSRCSTTITVADGSDKIR